MDFWIVTAQLILVLLLAVLLEVRQLVGLHRTALVAGVEPQSFVWILFINAVALVVLEVQSLFAIEQRTEPNMDLVATTTIVLVASMVVLIGVPFYAAFASLRARGDSES
jgi:hypothetical protein